jgi:hypothetical protein
MPKVSQSLTTQNIKDLLSEEEITDLMKYSQFSSCKERDYIYAKDELCLKLISLVIDKFNEMKENSLVKCLLWVKKQLQIYLEIKPDAYTFTNFEKMKKTQPNLKMKLGWMEEYSLMNQEEDIYKMIRRSNKSNTIIQRKKVKNLEKRNSLNPEFIKTKSGGMIINMNKISENLLDFKSPNFDIFKLENKVGKENILPVTSTYIFVSLNLFSIIEYTKFESFIFSVANGYKRDNPYHTDLHAADVVQSLLLYVIYGNLQKLLDLNQIDLVSIFISAGIHDLGHPGYTNNFLINTKNDLAIKYNDQSVLESYHVSEGFNIILKKEGCNIFENLSNDDYKIIRKRIIQCVLATDMTLHNKQYQFLKIKIETFGIKNGENFEKIFEGLDPVTSYNLKQEFLNALIHSADVSNPSKPLNIYKHWAKRCIDEFFKQGDMEKKLGIPVSFNCDRETVSLAQSQLGFIDAIVFPLFTVLVELFEDLDFAIDNLKKNREYFKGLKENNSNHEKKIKKNEIIKEEKDDEEKTYEKSED